MAVFGVREEVGVGGAGVGVGEGEEEEKERESEEGGGIRHGWSFGGIGGMRIFWMCGCDAEEGGSGGGGMDMKYGHPGLGEGAGG